MRSSVWWTFYEKFKLRWHSVRYALFFLFRNSVHKNCSASGQFLNLTLISCHVKTCTLHIYNGNRNEKSLYFECDVFLRPIMKYGCAGLLNICPTNVQLNSPQLDWPAKTTHCKKNIKRSKHIFFFSTIVRSS